MARWFPERYRQICGLLANARIDAGLSQTEVAEALGVTQQVISRVEVGDRRVDPAELEAFARLYRQPITYFYAPDEEG